MVYIIHNGQRPLSYFYGNGNGRVSEVIGFSWNNYFIFGSKKEAEYKIKSMKRTIGKREYMKNQEKILKVINKLKIKKK